MRISLHFMGFCLAPHRQTRRSGMLHTWSGILARAAALQSVAVQAVNWQQRLWPLKLMHVIDNFEPILKLVISSFKTTLFYQYIYWTIKIYTKWKETTKEINQTCFCFQFQVYSNITNIYTFSLVQNSIMSMKT